eukprot:6557415-Ditylum_brightwellii.AAC.2
MNQNECKKSFTTVSLPLSVKKKKSTSRKESGYNVYVPWFYLDFMLLEEDEEKESYLFSSGAWDVPANSMSDEDST